MTPGSMTAFHPTSPFDGVPSNDAFGGHEERFRLPSLSDRCGLVKRPFAGTRGKDEDAPIPAARDTATEPPGSTANRKFGLISLVARTGHSPATSSITSSARARMDCGIVRP